MNYTGQKRLLTDGFTILINIKINAYLLCYIQYIVVTELVTIIKLKYSKNLNVSQIV